MVRWKVCKAWYVGAWVCLYASAFVVGSLNCGVEGDGEAARLGAQTGRQPRMLIGIGAQKCGTGFLHGLLSQHPQIVPAAKKELHVFDSAAYKLTEDSHRAYLENWDETLAAKGHPENAVLLEITPRYILEPAAACRIKHLFPEAKFIVNLREPVSRAVSEINMQRRHCAGQKLAEEDGWPRCCNVRFRPVVPKLSEALRSLKSLEDECTNASSPDPWRRCPHNHLQYIARGIYAPQIAWWFQLFDPAQFLFINAHDLFNNPQEQAERVLRFVGVSNDWKFEISPQRKHIVFDESGLKEAEEAMAQAYEEPNKELYRLLAANGHTFDPFVVGHTGQHNLTMSLTDGQSLCCQQEFFEWEDVITHAEIAHSTCSIVSSFLSEATFFTRELFLISVLFGPFTFLLWKFALLPRHLIFGY